MKKKTILILFFMFISLFLNTYNTKSRISFEEKKWILSGAERSIYLVRLDKNKRDLLFDGVADIDSRIEVLTNSYNGKIILCKVVSKGKFSYWLINLDKNSQYPIIEGLKYRPSNTMITKDGKLISFTTSEKNQEQIWIYNTERKDLVEFDKNTNGGLIRQVRFSPNGQYAIFTKATESNKSYYRCLYIRDLVNNHDVQLTTQNDGNIDLGEFYYDNKTIVLARTLPGEDYNSLWDLDIETKKFTYITKISKEDISAFSVSKDGNKIALSSYNLLKPGKIFFWTLQKNQNSYLNYINETPSGMIGLRLSNDGRFIIYSSENSPTYLASFDGSFNEKLSSVVEMQNLKDANWYNHPPFPPEVKTKAIDQENIVTWNESEEGTYPIQGYKIYRSIFPDTNQFKFLNIVNKTDLSFTDKTANSKVSYYYLVRAFDIDLTESLPSNYALLDKTPPFLEILNPSDGILTKQKKILIKGKVYDNESGIIKLTLNNISITWNDGKFEELLDLEEGQNFIIIKAFDESLNESYDDVLIILDSIAPSLQIDFPQNNTELYALETNVRGSVFDKGSGIKSFTINEQSVGWDNNNHQFYFPININQGYNKFTLIVTDLADNITVKILEIMGVKKIIILLQIDSIYVFVNEIRTQIDAPPFIDIDSNRTMIPARFVIEPIGGNIYYEEKDKKIIIIREEDKIELWIGKNFSFVNGIQKSIDPNNKTLSPRIVNGRTYLPLRFVTENIGFLVNWNPILHQIQLMFPKKDLN